MERLKGMSALVTGSTSGIGKAIAIAMAREGANVVINFIEGSEDKANQVLNEIRSFNGKAIAIGADVSQEQDVKNMFNKMILEFGTIDILVNNAGIQKDSKFTEMSLETWQEVINVNLTGYFLCAREAAKEFLKRGVIKERSSAAGKIIFISSVHDRIPWAGHCNYVASKGAVKMLMKTVAQELAPYMIRANSISPGAIKTHINESVWEDPEQSKELLELIPYKRIGTPEDVAKLAVWLASDDSDYVNGETIYIDGGMTLYPAFTHQG